METADYYNAFNYLLAEGNAARRSAYILRNVTAPDAVAMLNKAQGDAEAASILIDELIAEMQAREMLYIPAY